MYVGSTRTRKRDITMGAITSERFDIQISKSATVKTMLDKCCTFMVRTDECEGISEIVFRAVRGGDMDSVQYYNFQCEIESKFVFLGTYTYDGVHFPVFHYASEFDRQSVERWNAEEAYAFMNELMDEDELEVYEFFTNEDEIQRMLGA